MNISHALSCRSDFSLGESTFQVDKMVAKAKELGYESVALVDIMSVSNMVAFTEKCGKAGIKPIIGCTIRVYDDPTYHVPTKASGEKAIPNPYFWLKVYAINENGLRSILKLLSKGNSKEYFYYHARVGMKEVLELQDVVVTTGDFYSLFHHPRHIELLKELSVKVPATFVEVVAIKSMLYETLNERAVKAAKEIGLPLLASRPVLYGEDADADSLDVLRAISMNAKMSSFRVVRPYIRDFSMKAPNEILKTLRGFDMEIGHVKSALLGMDALAGLCGYQFKKLPPSLPKMADNEFGALLTECNKGWNERFTLEVMGHKPAPSELPAYKARLAYELGVLKKMGFSGYFLLVQDIVKWAKLNSIIVGPGRGSVGGSLVAYLMGITDVDPIRFNLLFERFINPDRIDLPDADLDFMSRRRHEVVTYITDKYGQDRVAGLSNYNTLGAASALRDVARVHELDPLEYSCSKQVEKIHGVALSLAESSEAVPEIERFSKKHPAIWSHAIRLEGALRGLGQHAAGVVVAGEPLINRSVVETRSGGPVVNWDKKYVEDWGLIKMDILGLSTLDMLELGRDYVKARHKRDIDYLRLPLDDAAVLEAFGKGDTTGVFQFESPGMRRLLQELRMGGPLTFDDLVAVVALYRPGPLDAGLCDQYVRIKQGTATPYYEHPNMADAVKDTYGVIVYQEQVMQIARDVAGFTITEADHLRKAMGKKDRDAMAQQRDKWVKGCISQSAMTEDNANAFFDKIEVFAGYAFNKSHSVEYSIISWWTMWLKVHFPAEFFAASMTIADKDERIESLVNNARKNGIEVLPPDINHSSDRIVIVEDKKLYAPFQAVKGISENVTRYILQAREAYGKPFANRTDFYAALESLKLGGKVNIAHRDRLDKVGAFAACEGDKKTAMHSDRLRDRLEFLPGFTVDMVKPSRTLSVDEISKLKLVRLGKDANACTGCSLAGGAHPIPRMDKTPKFMVVFDSPSYQEVKQGRLLEGDGADLIKAALKDKGLSPKDGYFTALVKSPKPKGAKSLTNEQINGCSTFLMREIEILKPPIIVAMGAAANKFFCSGIKGGAENIGKVVFDSKLDASIIIGMNPLQVFFDPSKATALEGICEKLSELLT